MKLFELYGDIVINDDNAQGKIDGIDKKAGGLGGSFSKLGGAAMLAGGAIATGLGAALVDGVKGMMEAQDATAQLDAVLKSTGGAAGVTKEQAVGLADELERTTKFSYEAALAGQNMLLTFTNIGKDVFPQATQTAADMAQALGTDMAGQAMQLGKALNNPTEGISALTRVGVTFTEAQKEQIAAMQASGDMAGAQTIILQELQKEFGGSAVAAGQTFSGQLEILKNGLGNLTEGLASGLMPYLQQFVEFLNANMPAIQAVMEQVFAAIGVAVNFVVDLFNKYVLPVFQDLFSSVQGNLPEIQRIFEKVWGVIKALLETTVVVLSNVIGFIVNVFQGDWEGAWENIKNLFKGIWDGIVAIVKNAGPLLLEAAKNAGKFILDAFTSLVGKMLQIGKDIVQGVIDGVKEKASALMKAMDDLMAGAVEITKNRIQSHSPSKVFHKIGGDITQGLSNGITEGNTMVQNSMLAVVDAVVKFGNVMKEGGLALGASISEGVNVGLENMTRNVLGAARFANEVIRGAGESIPSEAWTPEKIKAMATPTNDTKSWTMTPDGQIQYFDKAFSPTQPPSRTRNDMGVPAGNVQIHVYDGFNGVRRELANMGLVMPTRA